MRGVPLLLPSWRSWGRERAQTRLIRNPPTANRRRWDEARAPRGARPAPAAGTPLGGHPGAMRPGTWLRAARPRREGRPLKTCGQQECCTAGGEGLGAPVPGALGGAKPEPQVLGRGRPGLRPWPAPREEAGVRGTPCLARSLFSPHMAQWRGEGEAAAEEIARFSTPGTLPSTPSGQRPRGR